MSTSELPQLNFPPYRFRLSREGGCVRIWDPLRNLWLLLTAEEWVRQHLIMYLIEECGAAAGLVRQECPVPLGGMHQRADVVVYTAAADKPLLLAECKAPGVVIDSEVFGQVVRYNSVLGARYIVATNGLRHYVREFRDGKYLTLDGFPKL